MKKRFNATLITAALLLSTHAMASSALHTATVDQDGNIVSQSPQWIKAVRFTSQKDYFATYEVTFKEGQFNEAPGFCSVSSTDTSDYERLLYGHAKLGGAATTEKLNVLGLMVGKDGASGHSSMSFQLMCSN